VIFDTDFLVAYTKGTKTLSKARAKAFVATVPAEVLLLFSQVTWMEFVAGYESSVEAARELTSLTMLPFTGGLWWSASRIMRDLGRRGEKIGTPDCMIAATALAYRQSLVSLNQSHFARVAGLRIITPE
jgi:predicted nucleic acid-binding protein